MMWTDQDTRTLLDLLHIDTSTPMELARSDIAAGQNLLSDYAARIGFERVHCEPAPEPLIRDPRAPLVIRDRAEQFGADFRDSQPNMVLQAGKARSPRDVLLFNVHMDTVAPFFSPSNEGGVIHGRGVADAKGLAIAVLAGVRQAQRARPDLLDRMTIQLQSPAGEEGGAMGWYGTRHLIERGFVGRLNIVCEPTEMQALDFTTANATARIDVAGAGSTDDDPCRGENASIILSHLCCHFAKEAAPRLDALGVKLCIAGVHTGRIHNRVFGAGRLYVGVAYSNGRVAERALETIESEFKAGLTAFARDYRAYSVAKAAAERALEITSLVWEKRGLPILNNRDADMEALLSSAGVTRAVGETFTCDAMWFDRQPGYTVVLGPGGLGRNGAHTEHEHLHLADLQRFADTVHRICINFASAPCG